MVTLKRRRGLQSRSSESCRPNVTGNILAHPGTRPALMSHYGFSTMFTVVQSIRIQIIKYPQSYAIASSYYYYVCRTVGKKHKPKQNKKATLKRMRQWAACMRERRRTKLQSSEPTLIVNNDAQTHVPTEQPAEPLVYVNIDMPSSAAAATTSNRKKLLSSEPTLIVNNDVQTLGPTEQPTEPLVYYVTVDMSSSAAATTTSKRPQKNVHANLPHHCLTSVAELQNSTEHISSLPFDVTIDDARSLSKEEIKGNRIIKIDTFFKELVKISSHDSVYGCGLHSMELQEETQEGLISTFKLHCNRCNKDFKINNSDELLNKNAVDGIIAAGCGHAQLTQFSAALDLPILSPHTYQKSQDEVCDEWEVTWEEITQDKEQETKPDISVIHIDKDSSIQ